MILVNISKCYAVYGISNIKKKIFQSLISSGGDKNRRKITKYKAYAPVTLMFRSRTLGHDISNTHSKKNKK